jgi:hypothetical protein
MICQHRMKGGQQTWKDHSHRQRCLGHGAGASVPRPSKDLRVELARAPLNFLRHQSQVEYRTTPVNRLLMGMWWSVLLLMIMPVRVALPGVDSLMTRGSLPHIVLSERSCTARCCSKVYRRVYQRFSLVIPQGSKGNYFLLGTTLCAGFEYPHASGCWYH